MPYKDAERRKACKRKHYEDNKQVYLARAKTHRDLKRDFYVSLKDKPCTDCNQKYHYSVMDWDHKSGVEKISEVYLLVGSSKEKLLAEIEKCDLVCANCHRIRTFKRQHNIPLNQSIPVIKL